MEVYSHLYRGETSVVNSCLRDRVALNTLELSRILDAWFVTTQGSFTLLLCGSERIPEVPSSIWAIWGTRQLQHELCSMPKNSYVAVAW